MESVKVKPALPFFRSDKSFAIAVVIVILGVALLSTYNAFRMAQAQTALQARTVVSEQALAEQYGLGVNLVAVTAAGGMIDLRLKIIDAAKAKALLGDQANYPKLLVGNNVILQAEDNIASQPIKFEDGGNLFVLYPNALGEVKQGDPVSIIFGNLQVEAINSR